MGCTPRRTSRSQRNDSPRSYLRPENVEGGFVADGNLNSEIYGNLAKISPLILHCPQYSTLDTKNPLHGRSFQTRNPSHVQKFVMLPNNLVPTDNHHASTETSASPNLWHVFPLHYGDQLRPDGSKLISSKASFMESNEIGPQQRLPTLKLDALNARCPSNSVLASEKEEQGDCDLTLRLGTVVVPRASIENSWSLQVENGDRSTVDRVEFKSHLNK